VERGADDAESRLERAIAEVGRVTLGRPRVGVSHDDADDVDGTIATDDAIGFDPLPVLQALHAHGARAVVMGQVAGILHGSKELTGDLDLLWDGAASHAPRMAAAFSSVDAALCDADGNPVPCTVASFQLPKVLFRAGSVSGDCCTPGLPWGGLDIDGFIDRAAVVCCRDGTEIRYVAAADLLTMRRAVGRPKDRRRALELSALLDPG
jgi:hypothetical protein